MSLAANYTSECGSHRKPPCVGTFVDKVNFYPGILPIPFVIIIQNIPVEIIDSIKISDVFINKVKAGSKFSQFGLKDGNLLFNLEIPTDGELQPFFIKNSEFRIVKIELQPNEAGEFQTGTIDFRIVDQK